MVKKLLVTLCLAIVFVAGAAFVAEPQQAYACQGGGDGSDVHFLGIIPPWHHYLDCEGPDGGIDTVQFEGEGGLDRVWLIGLALFEGLLRLSGLVAVFFVIVGGFKYVTSQGNADKTSSAQKTIINSLAGLVIAASASVLVSFLINILSENGLAGFTAEANANDNGEGAVATVFQFLYALGAVLAVMYIVIGSIKFAASTGDPGKASSARSTIIYAIVGLLVIIGANAITSVVLDEAAGSASTAPATPAPPPPSEPPIIPGVPR